MPRLKFFILCFALLPFSNCVFASQGGDGIPPKDPVITGSVSDASSKKPVKGVTVSVTAKDGVKFITTDASGKFIIPKLPAGEVTIQLEKKGYKTYRREKVIVKEGMQIKLSFDLSNLREEEDADLFHPLLRMIES
ncbi:MAG: carboxypeptidase regulatory-like domain-containing protein [Chitinophagaceae bacterium]|nr:carboxypeptidase regulatory-like domain-containing protein [Chitinophagaceae bacterium]